MRKRSPAPLPTEFHGITIGADQIRCGDVSGPLVGTRAMVRDESTTHDEVTARGIFGNALVGIFTTDEIGWSFSEPVPEGFVYLVVVGEAFAFEVPVEACYHPIGITYEPVTQRVWVACYGGQILVFDDR